jgi:general secretion pathway protein L
MIRKAATWWITHLLAILPAIIIDKLYDPLRVVVLEFSRDEILMTSLRRKGRQVAIDLDDVQHLAGRMPVLLRPPAEIVLERLHVVPAAPTRLVDKALRYELSRITPFRPEELFWAWSGQPKSTDKSRMNIHLIMIPRVAMASVLTKLEKVGIKPSFIEVGSTWLQFLPSGRAAKAHYRRSLFIRGLILTNVTLFVIVLLLPIVLQAVALRAADVAIADLQPTIAQIERRQRDFAAERLHMTTLVDKIRNGNDLLPIMETITHILPDSAFLTDFSLRNREVLLIGHAASAPLLITALSADPSILSATFAAPVIRIAGAKFEAFSIRVDMRP